MVNPDHLFDVVSMDPSHDDSKAFIILHIGLGVSLALLLGLFWLALVVGIHFVMEVVK